MNITFNSVHFKADQKLEKFISEKLEKLAKLHDGIIGFDVILKLENTEKPENKNAEIRAKIRGNDAIAHKVAKTFEEAADDAINALKKQLLKVKDKVRGN
ncbi:MAG: ribosome-associated translation inhibitor RaiA [Bacteroidetes bacterium]|nr:ribosome-associated translation inhibitor RaiA [Bacteroidota bacterium]MCL1969563.1 ribosome-associated translation inhibitor RaiA [Bacteroidota bacterium]